MGNHWESNPRPPTLAVDALTTELDYPASNPMIIINPVVGNYYTWEHSYIFGIDLPGDCVYNSYKGCACCIYKFSYSQLPIVAKGHSSHVYFHVGIDVQ